MRKIIPICLAFSLAMSSGVMAKDIDLSGVNIPEEIQFERDWDSYCSIPSRTPSTITVSAKETVTVVPDRASVQMEINEEADEADEAMRNCSKKAEKVKDALIEMGIAQESMGTVSMNTYPVTSYNNFTGQSKTTGYKANITIKVEDIEIDEAGDVISAGMEAGADEIGSLKFYCSDYDERYNEALAKAVETARDKAEIMANAEGMEVIRAVDITEGYQDRSYRYVESLDTYGTAESTLKSTDSLNASVMSGTADISASITAIFEVEMSDSVS